MAAKKNHLVGAYGLFWDRDQVDWTPGPGRTWQMLGRVGTNKGKLRVCDFRTARGIYVLFNDYQATYVGLAVGAGGFGDRLVKHTLPTKKQPKDMKFPPKDWNRFCWFSFDDVAQRKNSNDPNEPWCGVRKTNQSRNLGAPEAAKELEALMILALGIKAQNQMKLQVGEKWEQVTWTDAMPRGPLTKVAEFIPPNSEYGTALKVMGKDA